MKKILITTMMNLFCIICFGQNYTIKSEGVEDVVANYAKVIIDENISIKSGYEYEFTLLQDRSTFTISYLVNPNNITGQEQTNDLWSEIEQTIKRALNAIDSQIEDIAITQKKEEKQKAKKEEKQRVLPNKRLFLCARTEYSRGLEVVSYTLRRIKYQFKGERI